MKKFLKILAGAAILFQGYPLLLTFLWSPSLGIAQTLITPKVAGNGPNEALKPVVGKATFYGVSLPLREIEKNTVFEDSISNHIENPLAPMTSNITHDFWGGWCMDSNWALPDVDGEAGPNHYVQVVNFSISVYSKTGQKLFGPLSLDDFFSGLPSGWSTGDDRSIVLYDQDADRWLVAQPVWRDTPHPGIRIAVSQTPDPTGSWYKYTCETGNVYPQNPKFAVWPDGYYMSYNHNEWVPGLPKTGITAVAFERAKMLTGDTTAKTITFTPPFFAAFDEPWHTIPSDWDGSAPPAAGEPNHYTYLLNLGTGSDFLKMFDFHVDWITPSNSTFQITTELAVPANYSMCPNIENRQCIPQHGTTIKLQSLSGQLMDRIQYRNFGAHQSMVACQTIDVDGTGHAGIKWYELRRSGGVWSVYQQGIYSPDASHRWIPSISMNAAGDIALGFSISTTSNGPSIAFTGRRSGDPLGVMTFPEEWTYAAIGYQTNASGWWGEHSVMSVDPSDNLTFWYTNQTTATIPSWGNWWTKITAIHFPHPADVATLPASSVTTASATLNGTINPAGHPTTWHFEYGPTGNENQTQAILSDSGFTTAVVSANVNGLNPGTPSHFRLVAVNSDGTSDGGDISFIPGGAVLSTTAPTSITKTSAVSGGTITSNGGSAVITRGVCWSETADPTFGDSHTTNGSGNGTFTSSITGLSANTFYHARAYATNPVGTWYGEDVTFTTLCENFTLPYSEGFDNPVQPNCWTQIDHSGNGQIWQFGTITTYGTDNPQLSGNYAFLNSDGYGGGNTQNADLISPTFDFSSYASINISFSYFYRGYSNSTGLFAYSDDNGATWDTITVLNSTSPNPAQYGTSLQIAPGHSQVKFKWNYTGTWAYYWAIDNIQITGMPNNNTLPGTVVGGGPPVCFDAGQVLTVGGAGNYFAVLVGGDATLVAGEKIDFLPGATVQEGGYLHGYISPGGPFCSTMGFGPRNTGNTSQSVSTQFSTPTHDLFSIHPNPTSGTFILEVAGEENTRETKVEIFSMMGENVVTAEITGQSKHEFSLAGKSSGIYLVRVTTSNGSATTRIVKID